MKRSAAVHAAGNAYLSVVLHHEALANSQAKTRCVADHAESDIENVLDQMSGDSATGVGNVNQRANDSLMRYAAQRDIDLSASRRVADCIADEIKNDLAQHILIA